MRFFHFAAAAGVCLCALPLAARADQVTITGTNTITFNVAASPTPSFYTPDGGFTLDNIAVTENGVTSNEEVLFFEDGIAIGSTASVSFDWIFMNINLTGAIASDLSDVPGSFFSAPLYSGGESTPTLLPGTYDLSDNLGNGDLSLTIAADVAATPEPSSLLLLGTGVLGAAGILKRRFA